MALDQIFLVNTNVIMSGNQVITSFMPFTLLHHPNKKI